MKRAIKNIVEHSRRSEKSVERYLCDRVADLGGVCLKYFNPSATGYPDRVAVLPRGATAWVELKGADGRLAPLQARRLRELTDLGHVARVCASREDVDCLIDQLAALR